MSCNFNIKEQRKSAEVLHGVYELSNFMYASISNGRKLEEVECTENDNEYICMEAPKVLSSHYAEVGAAEKRDVYASISNGRKLEEVECTDSIKDTSENDNEYVSMEAPKVLSAHYAEVEAAEKRDVFDSAEKDFLVTRAKQSWKSKLLVCIAFMVLIIAVVICFTNVLAEIGIRDKMSGTSSSLFKSEGASPELQELIKLYNTTFHKLLAGTESHSEDVVQELQKLITNLELHNISFHELLTGLENQSEEIAKKLQKLITLESHSEKIAQELQELFFSLEVQNISLGELHAGLGSPGQFSTHPVAACSTLPPSFPSGYYWVRDSVGSSVRAYCDISFSCGGVTGGWMRVAELDMTNSSQQCPGGFMQRTDSNIRTCVRNTLSRGCSSVTYSTPNIHYSKVCGKVIGYQVGKTNAFLNRASISSFYVDGVSLTHGSTYEHIWTFAAALSESANSTTASSSCKCIITSAINPEFVGMDYFCDTGVRRSPQENTLYASNSLWDGVGCGSSNNCCSFNTPPWFYKRLREPTTDDIEMRVCRDESSTNEDIAIETAEIYIHT